MVLYSMVLYAGMYSGFNLFKNADGTNNFGVLHKIQKFKHKTCDILLDTLDFSALEL